MSLRGRVLSGMLFFLVSLSWVWTAGAQGPGQAHIHIHQVPDPQQVTTTSGAVGLSLQPTFSLLDAQNQLLQSFEIQDATIEIDGDKYKADVQELETPWTVVFLVDASKNMGSFTAAADFKKVHTSIANAVSGVPDATNMEVVTFANTAPPLLPDFTQKKDTVATAINNIRPTTTGNSCLNDGLYQAVNQLSGATGRKAVIAFTASADNCATKTTQDVLNLAQKNDVQIFMIGLKAYTVKESDMTAFTDPTGGLTEFRDISDFGFGLSNVIGILKNQWTAKATVYPSAGQKTATLTVDLKDGTELKSSGFTFTSSQDYIPPAEIHLKGKVQSTGDGIVFNLDLVQPQRIRQLNVTIVSKDTGESVLSQALVNFSDVNNLPAVNLSPGLEYTLDVAAVDSSGQVLSQDSADFKYEPPPAAVAINDVQPPTSDRSQFLVTIATTNLNDAVKFKAWFVAPNSTNKIEGTEVTVPVGDPILIPASRIASGKYGVVVQALDSTDTVLAESPAFQLEFNKPNMFDQFRSLVQSSPLAIAGLTGVCCLSVLGLIALVWIIIPKRREQSISVEMMLPERGRRQPAVKPGIQQQPPPEAEQPRAPSRPGVKPGVRISSDRPGTGGHAGSSEPHVVAPPAGRPRARLSLRFPAEPAWTVDIKSTPFKVGRRKDNEGSLPVDSASGVSGLHCTISFERESYSLLDEGSTYGTTVNSTPVVKGEPTQLKDGDVIGLGPVVKVLFSIP
jgi:von Willebrand factor type A domain/FHA domain